MKSFLPLAVVCFTILAAGRVAAEARAVAAHPDWQAFVAEVTASADIDREWLSGVFSDAAFQQSIIDRISRPAERVLNWGEYRQLFIQPERVAAGRAFLAEHAETLALAETQYGVPAEVIAAIIGIETYYGRFLGNDRVIEALATLAFEYPPRAAFFRRELIALLSLAHEESLDLRTLKGSYAGAMGWGQFIPSSYRQYAVDFDADGRRDLIGSIPDAIGSVANYLAEHRWQSGAPVAWPVSLTASPDESLLPSQQRPVHKLSELPVDVDSLPAADADASVRLVALEAEGRSEYWLTHWNFYVITRYNRSDLYAMAVLALARELEEQPGQ